MLTGIIARYKKNYDADLIDIISKMLIFSKNERKTLEEVLFNP